MNTFSFNGQATIKHLNPRKEGPEDEKALALDIKLCGTVPADLWDYFHEGIKEALYTDAGAAKNALMEAIGFNHAVSNCTMEILEQRFHGVEVSKFKLKPKDGWKAELTFSVTISPDSNEIAQFAEFLQDEVSLVLMPEPDLFNEQG